RLSARVERENRQPQHAREQELDPVLLPPVRGRERKHRDDEQHHDERQDRVERQRGSSQAALPAQLSHAIVIGERSAAAPRRLRPDLLLARDKICNTLGPTWTGSVEPEADAGAPSAEWRSASPSWPSSSSPVRSRPSISCGGSSFSPSTTRPRSS